MCYAMTGGPTKLAAFVALGAATEDILIVIESVELMIGSNVSSNFMQSGGPNRELAYVSVQYHYCGLGF